MAQGKGHAPPFGSVIGTDPSPPDRLKAPQYKGLCLLGENWHKHCIVHSEPTPYGPSSRSMAIKAMDTRRPRRHRTEQAKAPETARFQAPFYLPRKNLMSFGRETL